jgi:hypothetical protein
MRTALLAVLLLSAPAFAHPPVSVVVDGSGNVFYSDLVHVWRVSPDGQKSIVVPNAHTHELALDADGNLYGENARFTLNRPNFTVWRRTPAGRLITVVPRTDGYLQNYSFARDRAGNMYWVDRERGEIRKRDAAGQTTTVARGFLRSTRWLIAAPDGTLHLILGRDLVQVTREGELRGVARDVGSDQLMGLWPGRDGEICVADYGTREAKCVRTDGTVRVVAKAANGWSLAGGAYAPNGDLWLLEWSPRNEGRVRNASGVRRH